MRLDPISQIITLEVDAAALLQLDLHNSPNELEVPACGVSLSFFALLRIDLHILVLHLRSLD